jgi:hypothetical protein
MLCLFMFIYTRAKVLFICSRSTLTLLSLPVLQKNAVTEKHGTRDLYARYIYTAIICLYAVSLLLPLVIEWVVISIVDIMTCFVCLIYSLAKRLASTSVRFISLRLLCYHVAYMVYDRLTDYVMLLYLFVLLRFIPGLYIVVSYVVYSGAF